jgi:hypothetical protein
MELLEQGAQTPESKTTTKAKKNGMGDSQADRDRY